MKLSQLIVNICCALFMLALHCSVQASPGSVQVKTTAEVEVSLVNKAGQKEIQRMPAQKVLPGSEVIYTTTFRNIVNRPVGDVVIASPVPSNTSYVAGSARGNNTDIAFSVDGGASYDVAEKLNVKDGQGVRAAQAGDYTHVRWVYRGMLKAGESGEVSFRVKVK